MAAPGLLDRDALVALTKQALGGRNSGLMNDAWYVDRVNAAYGRICTFQGQVQTPGMSQPQFRVLRFFELYVDADRTISISTHNFVSPTTARTVYVDNVYSLTDDRRLIRKSARWMNKRNPDEGGVPRFWTPMGRGGVSGYYIHPRPLVSGDEISVRERVYQYPDALSTGAAAPVIPNAWHGAIWRAAAAEAAALIDWPEKETEMENSFMLFISRRRSPIEEAGAAGGRRHYNVGG